MGVVKATVLNAKHGVITEERFQKMTTAQWWFHYLEVLKFQKADDARLTLLLDQMELVGTMANPKAGKKLLEIKKLRAAKEEVSEKNFAQHFEELKKSIPAELRVTRIVAKKKPLLPIYKRPQPGIVVRDGPTNS